MQVDTSAPDTIRNRVVVADDEPNMSFLVRVILEGAGYEVVEATDGSAALVRVAEAPTQLVITDRMMPGMNGTQLVERLRANPDTASIPIVMLSAYPDMDADADVFMTKPFDLQELVRVAARLVSSPPRTQEDPS